MSTNFTREQKEIVARRLGYNGPMEGFDDYVASSPALEAKYSAVTQKYVEKMAKGGMVKKYAGGGSVTYDEKGMPLPPDATKATVELTPTVTADQQLDTTARADATTVSATADQVAAPTLATAEQVGPVETYSAAASTPAMQAAMDNVNAVQGTVSEDAQVTAATQDPTTTAVGDLEAAQLAEAQTVQAPPDRVLQAGETVQSAVDRTAYEEALATNQASVAQGTVTEDMTVQGQLAKLTTDFDASNPPAWAAGALRVATATMAARGIGASSMAGQALIQAAIESAMPIASADAKVFQDMALQNLSNKQQMAVLTAQQRAAFVGQEFDQQFQSKVINASKISDIANMNFTASQQIALENARLAQSVDLANLSNRQGVVMAKAAAMSTLEVQNLSNRQQAAVVNAQAFLAMDMTNIDNAQKTVLFKAQEMSQALLSDQAAANAALQFNATSQNQAEQFNATLTTQVSQFNSAQTNATNQFNVDQSNAIEKFNAEQQNLREQFNAQQRLVIDQSNVQWRRDISTADTAAINAANYLYAQNSNQLTLAEYNNQTQLYRDQISHAFDSYENDQQRITQLAAASIAAKATTTAGQVKAESDMWTAIGSWAIQAYNK